ncbi:MAG: FAD/NAD(P)-binding protein [Acidobacteriota bacterium]|nr:FAD/NAD(P)-binding protein [Acidobacteriota bacterium]
MKSIAIVGGGPAGATAAEKLLTHRPANRAFTVTVFEERPGWEKPCGGGITAKAARRYPFLAETQTPHISINEIEIAAANGATLQFRLRIPVLVYSRKHLNGLLLRRAENAGARIISDRIISFERAEGGWRLRGRNGEYSCDFMILAAGARSHLRSLLAPPIEARDLLLTFGYFTPPAENLLRVQFFEDFEGYAWAFPRPGHVSVGVAGHASDQDMAGLKRRLSEFMRAYGYISEGAPIFSHILPALGRASWRNLALAGDGWAVAGDAAGLVDPLTGEGIYFAMRSGDLLAGAILAGRPEEYSGNVWREFGSRHAMAAALAPRFYRSNFWGKPVTTRMVEFCSQSPSFMVLLQDLFEGSQAYSGLRRRVYKALGKGITEMAAGVVKNRFIPGIASHE